jgi:hypothetical protein
MKRELQQQKYVSKYAAKPAVSRWMGTAMAAGLEEYNKRRMTNTLLPGVLFNTSFPVWCDEIERFRRAGGVITDETFESRVPPLMERALTHYANHDVVPQNWTIHSVEHVFEHGGHARADLIVIDEDGYAPLDYKMKESLYVKPGETRDAARARTLLEYDNDWQLKHYVWGVRRFIGQPCNHYYIVLGELSPKPTYTLQRFDVSERAMQQWIDAAHSWWGVMQDSESDIINLPRMSPVHDNKYGKCEFYDACITYELDPTKFQHKYIQVERRK